MNSLGSRQVTAEDTVGLLAASAEVRCVDTACTCQFCCHNHTIILIHRRRRYISNLLGYVIRARCIYIYRYVDIEWYWCIVGKISFMISITIPYIFNLPFQPFPLAKLSMFADDMSVVWDKRSMPGHTSIYQPYPFRLLVSPYLLLTVVPQCACLKSSQLFCGCPLLVGQLNCRC